MVWSIITCSEVRMYIYTYICMYVYVHVHFIYVCYVDSNLINEGFRFPAPDQFFSLLQKCLRLQWLI